MKRYLKRTLVVMVVTVPVVAWGLKVYVSREYQERKVRATVVFARESGMDLDSLDNNANCRTDHYLKLMESQDFPLEEVKALCEQDISDLREFASGEIGIEICNRSRYRLDYIAWQMLGFRSGRSTPYNITPDDSGPFEARQRMLYQMRFGDKADPFHDDKILYPGECNTLIRGGDFASWDSLEVVLTEVRLSGAPW